MASQLEFSGKADAYLEWANHAGFDHFQDSRKQTAVAWKRSGKVSTTTVDVAVIDQAINDANVERAELAAPITETSDKITPMEIFKDKPVPDLVLGVIDDGCPFARPGFADKTGNSRVLLLWDQDMPEIPGTRNPSARYGRVLSGTDLKPPANGDDGLAYEAARLKNLRRRATHGAHVLDVLAGPVEARSRVSPSRFENEGQDGSTFLAPPWTKPEDVASQAPIFFVQLPKEAINDPTGRWLARHALDGLDFIITQALARWTAPAPVLQQANPQHASLQQTPEATNKKLVVNLSWGPQTGPHDGSSLLEEAFQERVDQCKQAGIDLHLILAAGNSYESRAHAQWPAQSGCQDLIWQVVPDSGYPQFLEIWWPAGTPLTDIDLTVRSPDGQQLRIKGANLPQDARGGILSANTSNAWGITVVPHRNRFMALLALAPTRPNDKGACPPHGRWHIDVNAAPGAPKPESVHVYIARNTSNMGGRRRGPDSHLIDPNYEATRHGRWPREEPPTSRVKREGTLSGIATGQGVEVAAGYVSARNMKRASSNPSDEVEEAARYSSSGPSAAPTTLPERNPDWALPTDESPYLRGVLAAGVREGTSVRLVGTSTAAPQLARKRANGEVIDSPDLAPPQAGKPIPPSNAPVRRGRRVGKGRVKMDKPRPSQQI